MSLVHSMLEIDVGSIFCNVESMAAGLERKMTMMILTKKNVNRSKVTWALITPMFFHSTSSDSEALFAAKMFSLEL